MSEPCDLSAVEARRLIGEKRLSPLELVDSCIGRIERVNPTPAGFCGVVGYRPSPGLVAAPENKVAWVPFNVDGPMARNVADVGLLLSAIAGRDPADPLSREVEGGRFADPVPADLSGLKVAVSEDLGFAPVDNSIRALLRERVAFFADRFGSCDAADPDLSGANEIFEVLRAVGLMAKHLERVEQTPEKVGPNVTANVKQGLSFSAADVARAQREHTALYRRFLRFMERYDLLICPAAAVPPFGQDRLYAEEINGERLRSYFHWIGITYGITLTTHPAIILPCGLDPTGTPFGIQVVGRAGEDERLLRIAAALEAVLAESPECRRPLPDLEKLSARTPEPEPVA